MSADTAVVETGLQLLVSEINVLHSEILSALRTNIDKAIRIGELLAEQKSELGHGQWLPWLEANIKFTDRTARNYMRVFENRDRLKSETLSDLTDAYRLLTESKVSETPAKHVERTVHAENGDVIRVRAFPPTQAHEGKIQIPVEAEIESESGEGLIGMSLDVVMPEMSVPPTAPKPHVSNNSGENKWYTPIEYIDAARRVMGEINLDPASCAEADEIVQADTYYTEEIDGLKQPWFGNVWLNPPYGQPLIVQFSERVSSAFDSGEISQAIVLVNNATDTKWFHRLLDSASLLCLHLGRVTFWHPRGSSAPLQGQVLLYFGNQGDAFKNIFSEFGKVVEV
jgi:hypothetical protein